MRCVMIDGRWANCAAIYERKLLAQIRTVVSSNAQNNMCPSIRVKRNITQRTVDNIRTTTMFVHLIAEHVAYF